MATANKSSASKAAARNIKAVPEDVAEEAVAPPKRGKKLTMLLLGVLSLAVLGAGARYAGLLAPLEARMGPDGHAKDTAKHEKKAQIFVPMENFTVNLFDDERYLQLGLTIEVSDASAGEALKQKMPL